MSFGHGICMPVDEWMPRISCDFPAEIDPQALRNDKKVGVNKCVTAEDEMWVGYGYVVNIVVYRSPFPTCDLPRTSG